MIYSFQPAPNETAVVFLVEGRTQPFSSCWEALRFATAQNQFSQLNSTIALPGSPHPEPTLNLCHRSCDRNHKGCMQLEWIWAKPWLLKVLLMGAKMDIVVFTIL